MSEWLTSVINNSENRGWVRGRKEGREEGLAQGEILASVRIYRNEMSLDNKTIIGKLMANYHLTKKVAESYVLQDHPEMAKQ